MTEQPSTSDDLTARIAALEREQSAVAAVLRIISRSPGNLDASLQAVAEPASGDNSA